VPSIQIGVTPAATPQQVASSLQILAVLTVLSLAPAVLILMTSFTRIVVVLSFLRSALSTGQTPPNQVLVGLALFLTLFVMAPVLRTIYRDAYLPFQAGQIGQAEALQRAEAPLKGFMLRQTRNADLQLFVQLSGDRPQRPEDVSLSTLVPAFVVSELKTAFEMGFVLFLPFVVIDLVVASTLMSMGMLMLPPVLVSLPFKVLLFVLVDGWNLVVRSLLLSFH
jgi:flagellar biosynthetic protein FliP